MTGEKNKKGEIYTETDQSLSAHFAAFGNKDPHPPTPGGKGRQTGANPPGGGLAGGGRAGRQADAKGKFSFSSAHPPPALALIARA